MADQSLPEVVERILRPVRAAVHRGESLRKFCERRGVSYSALYNLLHGRGTPRYATLLRMQAAIDAPEAVVDHAFLVEKILPVVHVHAVGWFDRRWTCAEDLGAASVVYGPRGSGITTLLSLLDVVADPAVGIQRSGAALGTPLLRPGTCCTVVGRLPGYTVTVEASAPLSGPCEGAIEAKCKVNAAEATLLCWPDKPSWSSSVARIDLGGIAVPVDDEVSMRSVVQHEYAREALRAVGSPCDGRLPRGSAARIVASAVLAIHRARGLILLDCVDEVVGPEATAVLLRACFGAVRSGLVGQVVVGTHRAETAAEVEVLGGVVLRVKAPDSVTGNLSAG